VLHHADTGGGDGEGPPAQQPYRHAAGHDGEQRNGVSAGDEHHLVAHVSILTLLLQGNVTMNLLPGQYTFSVDGYSHNSDVPSSITVPGTPDRRHT